MNPSFSFYGFSHRVSCSLSGPVLIAPSQFEVCGSSATVPNPISEAVAFFTCFDQPKVNDLDVVGTSCRDSVLAVLLGSTF